MKQVGELLALEMRYLFENLVALMQQMIVASLKKSQS